MLGRWSRCSTTREVGRLREMPQRFRSGDVHVLRLARVRSGPPSNRVGMPARSR